MGDWNLLRSDCHRSDGHRTSRPRKTNASAWDRTDYPGAGCVGGGVSHRVSATAPAASTNPVCWDDRVLLRVFDGSLAPSASGELAHRCRTVRVPGLDHLSL